MAEVTLEGVTKIFPGGTVAVDHVDLEIADGELLVLVGPSGSGKTTVLRLTAGLEELSEGVIRIGDRVVNDLHPMDRDIAMVFQSYALYPHMTVRENIGFGLKLRHTPKAETRERVEGTAEKLGLTELLKRKPGQLSGGQRQRVAIARALAVEPRLLVLDEPTSALDVTVQARVLDLIARLREERSLSYLLISHNLAVVEQLCEQIAVLYLGQVVEQGDARHVLAHPVHPYTRALRAAVPELSEELPRPETKRAEPPDPAAPPPGCRFHPRCPIAIDRCRQERPALREVGGRLAACHRAEVSLADEQNPGP
jgi:oligopeptide/dipeptide ABC transporter ATP-binding protein